MPKKTKLKPSWQMETRRLIADGYGVEDIAIMLKRCVGDIRFMVSVMRETGALQSIYGGSK